MPGGDTLPAINTGRTPPIQLTSPKSRRPALCVFSVRGVPLRKTPHTSANTNVSLPPISFGKYTLASWRGQKAGYCISQQQVSEAPACLEQRTPSSRPLVRSACAEPRRAEKDGLVLQSPMSCFSKLGNKDGGYVVIWNCKPGWKWRRSILKQRPITAVAWQPSFKLCF